MPRDLFEGSQPRDLFAEEPKKEDRGILGAIGDTIGGAVKGASRIGDTLLTPLDYGARALGIQNDFIGRTDRGEAVTDFMKDRGADTESIPYMVGDVGTQIAGTAGVGSALAVGANAMRLGRLAQALESGGMTTGANALKGFLPKAADIGIRTAGGAITGGASAALVNPEDAGIGAAVGAALPLPLQALGKGYQRVFGGSTNAAGKVFGDIAGSDSEAAIAALRANRDPLATAGQATVDLNNPRIAALQRYMEKVDSQPYYQLDQAQELRRAQMIGDIAQTPEQYAIAKQGLRDATDPLRERALDSANTAGELLPKYMGQAESLGGAAANKVADVRRMENLGALADDMSQAGRNMGDGTRNLRGLELGRRAEAAGQQAADDSLILGQGAKHAQYIADSLAEHGLRPLDASGIIGQINKVLTTPGDRAVTLNQNVLNRVRDKIAEVAAMGNGQINARDLYAIRKTEIADVVDSLAKHPGDGTKQRAAGLVASLKSQIDDAIEAAGGEGWKSYLKMYQKFSGDLDEMKVGKMLQDGLTGSTGLERQTSFANALKKASETPMYETGRPLIEALTPANKATVGKVQGEILRDVKLDNMAKKGASEVNDILGSRFAPLESPHILNSKVTIANKLLDIVQNKASKNTTNELAKLMRNPEELARAMEMVGPNERKVINNLMMIRFPAYAAAAQQ